MTRSSHDERVRTRAYHLWEEAGRPPGRDSEFWHRAMELEQGTAKAGSAGSGTAAHPVPSLAEASASSDAEATASAELDATAPLGKAPHPADVAGAAASGRPAKKAKDSTAPAQPKVAPKAGAESGGKPAKGAATKGAREKATQAVEAAASSAKPAKKAPKGRTGA